MNQINSAAEYSQETNILDRKAAVYLQVKNGIRQWSNRSPDPDILVEIIKIERWAIFWAVVAGAVSGIVLGGLELFVVQDLLGGQDELNWRENTSILVVILLIAAVVSIVEILVLYWLALRATIKMTRLAGMSLASSSLRSNLIARGLVRAALEFPDPHRKVFDIDPYAATPRWKKLAFLALYRMKVGLSSFLIRILLRRVLGRVALRSLIPLIAGPLYAGWNGIITWKIMKECRYRLFGPFRIEELLGDFRAQHRAPSKEFKLALYGLCGGMLVRSESAHPNMVVLIARLLEEMPINRSLAELSSQSRLADLAKLERNEQTSILKLLVLASIIDGRIKAAEIAMLVEAHKACKVDFREEDLAMMREHFIQGLVVFNKENTNNPAYHYKDSQPSSQAGI